MRPPQGVRSGHARADLRAARLLELAYFGAMVEAGLGYTPFLGALTGARAAAITVALVTGHHAPGRAAMAAQLPQQPDQDSRNILS